MTNKFFHEDAVNKAKSQKERQNQYEAFKAYVEESFSGVYETFEKLSAKLDAKMAQIGDFGSEVEQALSSLQEEIIELNKYLKSTREELRKMKFKNKIRDALSVGQFFVIMVLLLMALTGCASRSTVIYGHKAELAVQDRVSGELCVKDYTSFGGGEMIHAYPDPCNVKIIFKD